MLRPLASPLRLALLAHVYASLRANVLPSTPSYPAAVHILATRHLYDVAYVPPKKKKNSKKRTADEMGAGAAGPEQDPFAIQVEGEKLVDAIGKACEEYWTVLKKLKADKKGKGKERDQASTSPQAQQLWERFSGWLEEMAEQTDEEDLVRRSGFVCVIQVSLLQIQQRLTLVRIDRYLE